MSGKEQKYLKEWSDWVITLSNWMKEVSAERPMTKEEVADITRKLDNFSKLLEKKGAIASIPEVPDISNSVENEVEKIKEQYKVPQRQEFIERERIIRPDGARIRQREEHEQEPQRWWQKFQAMPGWQKAILILGIVFFGYLLLTNFGGLEPISFLDNE